VECGFPAALFLNEPSEHLLCSICLEVMKIPVQCPEGHSFCRTCISSSLASSSLCPMDRRPLQASSLVINRSLAGIIDGLRIKCPLLFLPQEQVSKKRKASSGKLGRGQSAGTVDEVRHPAGSCSWTGCLEDIAKHSGECMLATCACPNDGCRKSMSRGDLNAHAETCPAATVKCEHCNASNLRRSVAAHLRSCPRAPIPCPNGCGSGPEGPTLIPRAEIAAHRRDACPLEAIPCLYAGCGAVVARRDLDAHLRGHLTEEKEQLSERVVALRAEAEELRQRGVKLQVGTRARAHALPYRQHLRSAPRSSCPLCSVSPAC
jgi:TNF receptor-associated factor 4